MNLTEIAGIIAGLTLIVTNLGALFLAIKNTGVISILKDRIDDHSRRIDDQGSEIVKVAQNQEPPRE
jgi:hypothetical protein